MRDYRNPLPRKDSEWKEKEVGKTQNRLFISSLCLSYRHEKRRVDGDPRLVIGEVPLLHVHMAAMRDYRGP